MAHPQPLIDPPDVAPPGRAHERDVAAVDVAVEVETMVCPTCVDPVQPAPPGYWRVADGLPAPVFSHESDRSPLCRDRAGVIAEPVELELGVNW